MLGVHAINRYILVLHYFPTPTEIPRHSFGCYSFYGTSTIELFSIMLKIIEANILKKLLFVGKSTRNGENYLGFNITYSTNVVTQDYLGRSFSIIIIKICDTYVLHNTLYRSCHKNGHLLDQRIRIAARSFSYQVIKCGS